MVLRRGPRTRLGRGWPNWLVNPSFPSHKQNATQLMQRGVAIFSFYHRNYSKPSTDHLTHGVLMASIHPAGDSYNHRPSDLHDVCHPTGNFILSSSCVVWLVVRSRGSREKDSEKVSTYAWWYSYLRDCLSLNSQEIIHKYVFLQLVEGGQPGPVARL